MKILFNIKFDNDFLLAKSDLILFYKKTSERLEQNHARKCKGIMN